MANVETHNVVDDDVRLQGAPPVPDDEKPWYLSKGVIGALVAITFTLLSAMGVDVTEGEVDKVFMSLATIAGIVLAMIGRFTAKKTLG